MRRWRSRLRSPLTLVRRADTIKSSNSAFNEWHYVDTPFSPSGASVDVCDELQNVVWAMGQCVHVLNNGKADVGNRALMARLLVHFVGDIHQPLHATALFTDTFPGGDAGGNSIKLSPPAPVGDYTSSNLHSYWDSGTANSGLEDIKSGDLEAIRLMAELLLDDEAAQIAATPLSSASAFTDALKAWAQESFLFASNSTYAPALLDALGSGKTVDTSAGWWAGYGADNSVLVRDRLRLGGARLAQVLNSIYG